MLTVAAVVPAAPILVPEVASGAAPELDDVRAAIGEALVALTAAKVDAVVCVGSADETVGYPSGSVGSLRGFGIDIDIALGESAGEHPLPTMPPSLTVLAWLVARFLPDVDVTAQSIALNAAPEEAGQLGAAFVGGERRIGLIVAGDGSAALTEKSPGYFVDGAVCWQSAISDALASADVQRLAALTADDGERYVAAGRAPLQVLAGAAQGRRWRGRLLSDTSPYGVGYPVAVWEPESA